MRERYSEVGERTWSNMTQWEDTPCCQGSHRGPKHRGKEEAKEGGMSPGPHMPCTAGAQVASQRPSGGMAMAVPKVF